MKTLTFLLSFMFTIALLQAQNYQINFTGSGQSAFVDSIQVKNLTQGTTLSLNGSDVLYLVGTVGINTLTANEKPIKLFPNPMVASTVIEFVHANTGPVCIEIFNEMGVLIMKHSRQIQQGTQRYEISGLNTGIYTVNVSTADIKYAAKLISLGKNSGNSVIKHQRHDKGSVSEGLLKSTKDLVQMQYNDGEIILLKGFAGDNASVLTLLPTQSQTVNFEFISCSDDDGNNYAVVTLDSQDWMAENLNYETVDSWWYDNNSSNGDIYGRLYTWDAAIAACPDGWHLPTDDEWKVLEMYLGMSQSEADMDGWRGTDEGKKLKSTSGWDYSIGTDSVGFTALPGGYYIYHNETFDGLGYSTYWWSATENTSANAWFRGLFSSFVKVSRGVYNKQYGYSVRCVRD